MLSLAAVAALQSLLLLTAQRNKAGDMRALSMGAHELPASRWRSGTPAVRERVMTWRSGLAYLSFTSLLHLHGLGELLARSQGKCPLTLSQLLFFS